MNKNAHKIVTWIVAFALVGLGAYSLSLFYWALGIIFVLSIFLVLLLKFPPNDD